MNLIHYYGHYRAKQTLRTYYYHKTQESPSADASEVYQLALSYLQKRNI